MARGPFAAGAANPSANQNRVETIGDYLERLASNDPVPGGGSAAALTAAVAAALTAMVGRIQTPPNTSQRMLSAKAKKVMVHLFGSPLAQTAPLGANLQAPPI